MANIIVTELRAADRERWSELWRGYLDFYEATLPLELYTLAWERLMTPDGAIRGFGAPGRTRRPADRHSPLSVPRAWLDPGGGVLSPGSVRRYRAARRGKRPGLNRARCGGGERARLRPALLDDQGGQRDRASALRPHRPLQRLHPLRLPARLSAGARLSSMITPQNAPIVALAPKRAEREARARLVAMD